MAYTNPWSDTIPQGSELAKNIDDFMRQTRLDIHERMDSLVEDWTADPVAFKSGAGANVITIPFPAFVAHSGAFYPTYSESGVACPAAGILFAPITNLVVGRKINHIKWGAFKGTGNTSINLSILKMQVLTLAPVTAVVNTLTQSATDNIIEADLTEVIAADMLYFLEVTCIGANPFTVYGAQISYAVA